HFLRDSAAQQALRQPVQIHHHGVLIFHRQNLQLLRPVAHHLRVPMAPAFSLYLRSLAASAICVLVLTPRSPSCFLQQLHLPLRKRFLFCLFLSSFFRFACPPRFFRCQHLFPGLRVHVQLPVLPRLPSLLFRHATCLFRVPQRPLRHLLPPSRRVRRDVLHHPFRRIILQPRHISHPPRQTSPCLRLIHRRRRRQKRDLP